MNMNIPLYTIRKKRTKVQFREKKRHIEKKRKIHGEKNREK